MREGIIRVLENKLDPLLIKQIKLENDQVKASDLNSDD